ncbi:MAG: M15 family metallopeptidase [Oscillospiraceae bacterium]|nr:M15 family metallopeptidase [Oscillospiraceae bacterium]
MAKKRKRKISTKALIIRYVAYILLIALFTFAIVRIVRHFTEPVDDEDAERSSDTSVFAEIEDETASESKLADTDVGNAEAETVETGEQEDAVEIDNEWAMFLVNKNNPLPDNYDDIIETSVIYSTAERDFEFDSRAAEYMTDMIAAAKADGINLTVISSYRTIEYQQYNFDRSVQQRVNDGMTYDEAYEDTAKEVAFPGESEHNAGLSADIFSDEYYSLDDDGFKNTKAYEWLMENAADYGFILRYPEGKEGITGFIYEPWHYRFIGVYYAHKVQESGLCLEEYFESQGWLDENGRAIEMTGPVSADSEQEDVPASTTYETVTDDSQGVVIVV